eukprot:7757272-Pyramimonas_sp.AAC.1
MHVERLLAAIKRSGGESTPYLLERFVADGYLSQWVTRHIRKGGRDPRVETRSTMIAAGVPLQAQVQSSMKEAETRGGTTGLFLHAKERPR